MRWDCGISSRQRKAAFTRIEFAVILGVLSVLAMVALPLLANNSARSDQAGCLNNLRQIGIAFQAWGNDYDDRRPWSVPANHGGSSGHVLRNEAWFHYTFLSNHIAPGVLMDPSETVPYKRRAENWAFRPDGGFLHSAFKNNAISYMFSLHTALAEANNILAADRHVQFSREGFCPVGGTTLMNALATRDPFFRGWTNNVHGLAGNVLHNDGHGEYVSQERLKAVLFRNDDAGSEDHFVTPF
jgi:competence protein ComGC